MGQQRRQPMMTSRLVTGAGQWPRVRCSVSGEAGSAARLRIYVVGKS
jgi:hypothetical protein